MIDKRGNQFIYTCDTCYDEFATGTDDFYEGFTKIKEEGWYITRNADDTEWVHTCNNCVLKR